jgi:hypothetical protein
VRHVDIDGRAADVQARNQGHDVLRAEVEVAGLQHGEGAEQRLALDLAQAVDACLLHEIEHPVTCSTCCSPQVAGSLQGNAHFVEANDVRLQAGDLRLDQRLAIFPPLVILLQVERDDAKRHDLLD